MSKENSSFEASIKRLEEIVQTMESTNLSIRSLTEIFEEGVALLSKTKDQLAQTELQILKASQKITFNSDSQDGVE
jgi:exodeoxyribonuclease VII small subunit